MHHPKDYGLCLVLDFHMKNQPDIFFRQRVEMSQFSHHANAPSFAQTPRFSGSLFSDGLVTQPIGYSRNSQKVMMNVMTVPLEMPSRCGWFFFVFS